MTDISFALEAKSDQLNAVDIMGYEPVIHIRQVVVKKCEQPVSIFFDGDNNRPWKPSKGMLRILAGAWGRNSKDWVGKYVKLYFEPSVRFGAHEVGGIQIRALSDIDPRGLTFVQVINRNKRVPYYVPLLEVQETVYPDDKFQAALPAMVEAMREGKMTLQQVIARCQKTGSLTKEQLAQLEAVAPVVIEENDEEQIPVTNNDDDEVM